MTESSKQHGGKRPGAGRKPESPAGPAVKAWFRLAPDVLDRATALAASRGLTLSKWVAQLVTEAVTRPEE